MAIRLTPYRPFVVEDLNVLRHALGGIALDEDSVAIDNAADFNFVARDCCSWNEAGTTAPKSPLIPA